MTLLSSVETDLVVTLEDRVRFHERALDEWPTLRRRLMIQGSVIVVLPPTVMLGDIAALAKSATMPVDAVSAAEGL